MVKKHIFPSWCVVVPVLCAIQWLLVPPWGNFPLNDDWTAALSVKAFIESGEAFYAPWLSAMSHVSILYGIVVTKLLGFSFDALRMGTIILALGSLALFYAILRRMAISKSVSWILVGLLAVNPLFINLSYTFLSDIPALFLLLLSFYCYLRSCQKNTWWLFFAVLISVVGFFTRQINLLLLVAIGLVSLKQCWEKKLSVKQCVAAFSFPLIIGVAVYLWLGHLHLLPGQVGARFLSQGMSYAEIFLKNIWQFATLIALFFSPIVCGVVIKNGEYWKQRAFWLYAMGGGVLAVFVGYYWTHFQLLGNIISRYGLGATREVMQGDLAVWGKDWWYVAMYVLGGIFVGMVIFLLRTHRNLFSFTSEKIQVVVLFILLYGGLLCVIQSYDRYLLVLLPFLLILLAPLLTLRCSRVMLIALILVQWGYGVVGEHNYLAWNQARWELGDRVLHHGVNAQDIEGGYEWNGWMYYRQTQMNPIGTITPAWAPWYVHDLYPGDTMPYIIAFSPLGGYRVIDSQKVDGWLHFPIKTMYTDQVVPKSIRP